MILKTLSRKSNTGQLVKYILRYIFTDKTTDKKKDIKQNLKSAFLIRHNIRSNTLEGMIQEINANEAFRWRRQKNNIKLLHNIISFSPKDRDKITDEMLRDIAEKFISERNPNCQFIGVKHDQGVEHIHLHLIQSPCEISGRNASISRRQFLSLKKTLQMYQAIKYPQLIHSLPNLTPATTLSKEALIERVKAARQTNKAFVIETLEGVYADAQSKDDYMHQLEAMGCKPYYRGAKLQGIQYDGLKYRFSKIGMTEELLDGLDQKEKLNSALIQFEKLRGGVGKNKNRQLQEKEHLPQEQPKVLEDLAKIRNRSNTVERNIEEQDTEMEIPSLDLLVNPLQKLRLASIDRSDSRGNGEVTPSGNYP